MNTPTTSRCSRRGVDSAGITAAIQLEQSIFDWGHWKSWSASRKAAARADVVYQGRLQALIQETAKLYFDVLEAKEVLRTSQAENRAYKQSLEQMKQKFKVGLVPIANVHDAQATYDASVSKVIQNDNDLANNFEALRAFTGVDYVTLASLDVKRFSPSPLNPAKVSDWLKTAEASNFSVLAARLAKDLASDNVTVKFAGHPYHQSAVRHLMRS